MRAEALQQLGLWGKVAAARSHRRHLSSDGIRARRPAVEAVTDATPKLLGKAPESVQLAALDAIGSLDIKSLEPLLVALVSGSAAPEAVRVAALKTLDTLGGDEALRGVDAADKSGVPALQLAALQIAAHRAPARALPLVKRFATEGSEAEQRAAFQAIPQLPAADGENLLLSSMDRLAAGKVLPGAQVELLDAVEKSTTPAVKARWEKQQATWAASGDAIAPYRSTLAGGNPGRGFDQFFNNAVLPCGRCHHVYGEGGEAGPDLSRIGKDKTAEYLIESVVKPNNHIASGFDIVTFALKDGGSETGSIVSESPQGIVLRRGDKTTVNIAPASVATRTAAPSSMPEIYGQVMSRAELRDVVAFLQRLDGSRVPRPGELAFGETNRAMSSVTEQGAVGGHP